MVSRPAPAAALAHTSGPQMRRARRRGMLGAWSAAGRPAAGRAGVDAASRSPRRRYPTAGGPPPPTDARENPRRRPWRGSREAGLVPSPTNSTALSVAWWARTRSRLQVPVHETSRMAAAGKPMQPVGHVRGEGRSRAPDARGSTRRRSRARCALTTSMVACTSARRRRRLNVLHPAHRRGRLAQQGASRGSTCTRPSA